MDIAKFLEQERTNQGISQAEFAFVLGKTKGHLSNIERKKVSPSVAMLAEAFNWLGYEITTLKLSPTADAKRLKSLKAKLLEFKLKKANRVRKPRVKKVKSDVKIEKVKKAKKVKKVKN